MSHRWNCPTPEDARRQARSDAEYDFSYGRGRDDWRRPYDCDEGNRAYRREYESQAYLKEEEQAEARRAERRRQEHLEEEERQRAYWAEDERRRDEERAYWEAEFAFCTAIEEAASVFQGAST
jgi:hypothetical protein